jgi:hypothetical protein
VRFERSENDNAIRKRKAFERGVLWNLANPDYASVGGVKFGSPRRRCRPGLVFIRQGRPKAVLSVRSTKCERSALSSPWARVDQRGGSGVLSGPPRLIQFAERKAARPLILSARAGSLIQPLSRGDDRAFAARYLLTFAAGAHGLAARWGVGPGLAAMGATELLAKICRVFYPGAPVLAKGHHRRSRTWIL